VSDDELKVLAGLRRIERLDVSGNAVTDEGVGHIASLRSLKQLGLRETQITGRALRSLAQLPSREALGLAFATSRMTTNSTGCRGIEKPPPVAGRPSIHNSTANPRIISFDCAFFCRQFVNLVAGKMTTQVSLG
jgi:hypothetical protein